MKQTSAVLVACGALLVSIGCSSSEDSKAPTLPSPESLSEGVNVIASSDEGVRGAFKKGSAVVYFETRRGAPMNEFYKNNDPDVGAYEMDARFLDVNGHTMVVQRGGDAFVEPRWNTELKAQAANKGLVFDRESAKLTDEAATAIALHQTLGSVALHQTTLASLGHAPFSVAVAPLPNSGIHAQSTNASCTFNINGTTADESCNWGLSGGWNYEIHYKCIALCIGDHSSTKVWSGSYTLYSCNHGACAYNMSSTSCQVYNQTGGYYEAEGATDINTVQGGCQTPYGWNSGGGTHNCHDDSTVQGQNVIWGDAHYQYGACQGQNWWKAPGNGHPCPANNR